jgi:(p)ppGpp synthase/HD superfamily hydrolase
MHFVLEVANRQHLARVMRALRRLADVKKISRVRE